MDNHYRHHEESTTSALLSARCQLQHKINTLRQYRTCSPAEINSLKRVGLSDTIKSIVGSQRYFDSSAILQLVDKLNSETSLSWSVKWFNGAAWICASYDHIMPALVFSLSSSFNYRLAKFSLNIKRENDCLLLN